MGIKWDINWGDISPTGNRSPLTDPSTSVQRIRGLTSQGFGRWKVGFPQRSGEPQAADPYGWEITNFYRVKITPVGLPFIDFRPFKKGVIHII